MLQDYKTKPLYSLIHFNLILFCLHNKPTIYAQVTCERAMYLLVYVILFSRDRCGYLFNMRDSDEQGKQMKDQILY